MSVKITKGNKSDLSIASVISEGLSGKLFGDKAYISKELFSSTVLQWSTFIY
ncbi:transposase [Orientia tsutsugamushi str. Ikeda]|uniref:Transposase n=1 Tax=Orientia tsutsugamushi (strain Ikeda) TaxID=334380 RepID=B3CSZ7_ORITI|nr:transposase [Orientia tsutsugamushi str. Ikeda]